MNTLIVELVLLESIKTLENLAKELDSQCMNRNLIKDLQYSIELQQALIEIYSKIFKKD